MSPLQPASATVIIPCKGKQPLVEIPGNAQGFTICGWKIQYVCLAVVLEQYLGD
jgi:hypothetical protein